VAVQPIRITAFGWEPSSARSESVLWRVVDLGERIVAGILLLLSAPILLAAGFGVVVLSRRSPVIAHKRVGRYGRPLWVLKLRTMWDDSPPFRLALVEKVLVARSDFRLKTRADARVRSRFAAWCRRYSIDELPQLWNVVRGDMALIGPRPLTAEEIQIHYGAQAVELLSRKPGISGLWQISGRSLLSYRQRRRLDLFMIRKWSVRLYLRILAVTVPNVIAGRNAW
jgi:exopolysaccharide production protein ExoY